MYKVHFSYWKSGDVWCYRFIDVGLAPLGAVRRTRNPAAIKSLAERGRGLPTLEAKLMLDLGLKMGQGGMYLSLDDNQYRALKK